MPNDSIIKVAFIISLTGHCLLLGVTGFNFSSDLVKKPEDVMVRIEVEKPQIIPKIDVLGDEKKLQEIAEVTEQPEPEPKPEMQPEKIIVEETLKGPAEEKVEVIDPTQEAMLRYQDMVKQEIESCRRYPYWAKRQRIEGTVAISFTVLPDGSARNTIVTSSSGYRILDDETIAMVNRASPFPPIPTDFDKSEFRMEVTVLFRLD